MRYPTTITSKGTITIPSKLRKVLQLEPGRKVHISLDKSNRLLIDAGVTMNEFEEARQRLVSSIPREKLGISGRVLRNAIEEAKIAEYKKKHTK